MFKLPYPAIAALASACLLAACSPKFDWRDYRSPDAPFTALFPGKPASFSREVDLEGVKVQMSMAASEIDGATFAVASAEMADAAQARATLAVMKQAMLNNIKGSIDQEKSASAASANGAGSRQQTSIALEAHGMQNGKPVRLVGRFVAHDKRIYQIIAIGDEKHLTRDNIDTFMTSVKLN